MLLNGFTPAAENTFDILDWGTLFGTFDTLQLPGLAAGLTWNTSQFYTTGVLTVDTAALLGDYNQNGRVDAADYVVWRKSDGSQAGYDLWRTNLVGLRAAVRLSLRLPPCRSRRVSSSCSPRRLQGYIADGPLVQFEPSAQSDDHVCSFSSCIRFVATESVCD